MMKDLAVEEILRTLGDAKTVTLRPGDVLFHEGEEAHAMYILKQGTLRVLSGSTILETVRDGGIIGEMALIEHLPRSATAIAVEPTKLSPIDQRRFLFLVQHHPFFALEVMQVLAHRLLPSADAQLSRRTPEDVINTLLNLVAVPRSRATA